MHNMSLKKKSKPNLPSNKKEAGAVSSSDAKDSQESVVDYFSRRENGRKGLSQAAFAKKELFEQKVWRR